MSSGISAGSKIWYSVRMRKADDLLSEQEAAEARRRGLEMEHLQEIEGNPLTAEEKAMFEMFDRERWSYERRRAYLLESFKAGLAAKPAAE